MPPQIISETNDHRDLREVSFERSRRDAPYAYSNFAHSGHVTGQGQVKGQNRVYSLYGSWRPHITQLLVQTPPKYFQMLGEGVACVKL